MDSAIAIYKDLLSIRLICSHDISCQKISSPCAVVEFTPYKFVYNLRAIIIFQNHFCFLLLLLKMNRNKQKPNYLWKPDETIKLLVAMKKFQILWIPHISKGKYQKAIKIAQRRLAKLVNRPWMDILRQLGRLRFEFKTKNNWEFYREMKRSVTVNGKVIKPTMKFDYKLILKLLFCLLFFR